MTINAKKAFNAIYAYHKAAYASDGILAQNGWEGNPSVYQYTMELPLSMAEKMNDEVKAIFLSFAPKIVDKVHETYASNFYENGRMQPLISETEFKQNYQMVWNELTELSNSIENGTDYTNAVKNIHFDHFKDNYYHDLIFQFTKEIEKTAEMEIER